MGAQSSQDIPTTAGGAIIKVRLKTSKREKKLHNTLEH